MKRKKLLAALLAAVMGLTAFAGCSAQKETAQSKDVSSVSEAKNDFELTLDVPAREYKVGETVDITGRIYNRSGKDIEIYDDIPEQEIVFAVVKAGTEPQFTSTELASDATVFKKDTYIENKYEYKAKTAGEFQIFADGNITLKKGEKQSQQEIVNLDRISVDITVTE